MSNIAEKDPGDIDFISNDQSLSSFDNFNEMDDEEFKNFKI